MIKKFIGNKIFYKSMIKIALPIIIQSAFVYLVGFIDNIMVGQIGTEAISAVAIVNQFHHIFYTCLVGIVASGSIFGAQFYGKKDIEGFRETFKLRLIACFLLSIAAFVFFLIFGKQLILFFLHSQNTAVSLDVTLQYGIEYISILILGFIPLSLTAAYTSSIKDMGETLTPMFASVAAIISNTLLNYVLILGEFGFPALGVKGAAIATVISRFLELAIIIIAIRRKKNKLSCLTGAFKKMKINTLLLKRIIKKGLPLIVNELLWSVGTVLLFWCYSVQGIEVIAALNIATGIYSIFTVVYLAIGNSVSILIGQKLGAGRLKDARDANNKLFFVAMASSILLGILLLILSPILPKIYNTSPEIHSLAAKFIYILAACLPISTFTHVAFFTIRAGGSSLVAFLYDCLNLWVITLPLAFYLTHYTDFSILQIYFLCQAAELVKLVAGFVLVKKGGWLNNIVGGR